MKKSRLASIQLPDYPHLWGLLLITFIAYGRLLTFPSLHLASPENDTWNLSIRWSVLHSLREGHIPLWNPLSAFGIPWLATWQTETFYPFTLLFNWLGLSFWNYSGILHLLIFSLGIYFFLRNQGVKPFGAFLSASLALLNACAVNHLGSNSSMDTMAWLPWVFLGAQETLENKPWGQWKLGLAVTLQIFAGYPQIIFYTLFALAAYALFAYRSITRLILPLAAVSLLTIGQWLPSLEYFFFQAVRLPAIANNPDFVLPLNNLLTFITSNALAQKGLPDYVVSPTYFYFNFYSGLIPIGLILTGLLRFKKWRPGTAFWFFSLIASLFWTFGFFSYLLELLHLPHSVFLEPAKAWVLVNFIELVLVGFLWESLFARADTWKWGLLAGAILNLLIPIWTHPLEKNLIPPSPALDQTAQKVKDQLGSGRALVLIDQKNSGDIYTPLPDPNLSAHFKYFAPNTNLFAGIPLANFYGSTCPSWGAMNSELYFKYAFPYTNGTLLDLLGVDLLYLNQSSMPPPFVNAGTLYGWTLWKNPHSLGRAFIYKGDVSTANRKDVFSTFASGESNPQDKLYLERDMFTDAPRNTVPSVSDADNHYDIPANASGYLVVTQNAMPGWKAWVDGKPTNLYLADWIFQCIPIPQGTQSADLRYEPTSFRLGLFVSLMTLAGLLIAMTAFLWQRQKP